MAEIRKLIECVTFLFTALLLQSQEEVLNNRGHSSNCNCYCLTSHAHRSCIQYTVSPRREAKWLITEGGLSSEFTSHGFYSENVFQMTGQSGL